MAKKKKSKWVWLLWGIVAFSAICVFLTPLKKDVPRTHWRVPVTVHLPSGDAIKDKLPDMPTKEIEVLRDKIGDTLEQALPTLPEEPSSMTQGKKEGEQKPLTAPVQTVSPPSQPIISGNKRIAIIIDDMGLNPSRSARAAQLPGRVTLSYLPYAHNLRHQTEEALKAGHDLLLHLPMEPVGTENPGPDALLASDPVDLQQTKLDKNLASFEGYVGVNNHMGSKFTLDVDGMRLVAETLRDRGVFFVDSRTNSQSVANNIVRQAGVRTIARDIFLDDTLTAQNVEEQLRQAERLASKKGKAVVIGHPHTVTLEVLEQWIPSAQSRGFQIVPVRDLVE